MNESHVFGVLFSCLLGLVESWSLFSTEQMQLKVALVHQHVTASVRSRASSLIRNSLVTTTKFYSVYLVGYFVFGHSVRNYLTDLTRLQPDVPLNSVASLLSISLAFRYILAGASCLLTIRLSNLLFQLFQIKVINFLL